MPLRRRLGAKSVRPVTLCFKSFIAVSLRPGYVLRALRLSSYPKTAAPIAVRAEGAHAPDPMLRFTGGG